MPSGPALLIALAMAFFSGGGTSLASTDTPMDALLSRPEGEWITLPSEPWQTPIAYRMQLPDGFDESKEFSVLILLPPGKQDEAMVDAAWDAYVQSVFASRGWAVVCPAAPAEEPWSERNAREFDRLLMEVGQRVRVKGGKFHFAGVSAGGRSILQLALLLPERCETVTVLPGYIEPDTKFESPPTVPLRMFVGEKDEPWKTRTQATSDAWRTAGGVAEVEVLAGQEHMLKSLSPRRLLDSIEKTSKARAQSPSDQDALKQPTATANPPTPQAGASHSAERLRAEADVWALLDRLHLSAATADEAAYFGCYTPHAVFLGTDPDERWTIPQFRDYARRSFAEGRGWKYLVTRRAIRIDAQAGVAWFDEALSQERYGVCRGVGVAERTEAGWKVSQYGLSVPVPNALLDRLVTEIRR